MTKAQFLSVLDLQKLPPKRRKWWKVWSEPDTWRLGMPLRYWSKLLDRLVEVPEGFVTDRASVPRLPLAYLLAGGAADEGAVVHDYLYQTHPVTRAEADAVLLEAMEAIFEPIWRRQLIYRAVRCCGWVPWNSGPKRFKILNSLE